jgi:hypothetical protein
MSVFRKSKNKKSNNMKKSSKSSKRSNNLRNNKKTRKHMRKMMGGNDNIDNMITQLQDNEINEINIRLNKNVSSLMVNIECRDENNNIVESPINIHVDDPYATTIIMLKKNAKFTITMIEKNQFEIKRDNDTNLIKDINLQSSDSDLSIINRNCKIISFNFTKDQLKTILLDSFIQLSKK